MLKIFIIMMVLMLTNYSYASESVMGFGAIYCSFDNCIQSQAKIIAKKHAVANAVAGCVGQLGDRVENWRVFSTVSSGHDGNIEGVIVNAQTKFECTHE